jgi:glycosyltransferase involved in cell wall biosynthesis
MIPRISIITPSFNQVRFIEKTLVSVISQGYPNLEYIVMDGGSTDGTVEIIKRYSRQLTHWVSAPDDGQADAIRRGFELSTGEIMGYVNSDDLLLPGSLEYVAWQFRQHPEAGFLAGGFSDIDEHGHVTWCHWPITPTFERLLLAGFYVGQPACFWTRQAYQRAGGIDASFKFTLDHDLFLRILQDSRAIATNRLLACFRSHPQSKSALIQHVHMEEQARIYSRSNRELLLKQGGRRIYRTWRLLTKLNSGLQQLRLLSRFGNRHPWNQREMVPEELMETAV